MDSTIKISSSEKTACLLVKSSTNKCFRPSRTTVRRWNHMVKKLNNSNNSSNKNSQRKTQFRIRFKRLSRFVLKTLLCSETLSSQQTMPVCIMTQSTHQSTPWICQWSSGRDLKKSVKTKSHACSKRT